MNDQQGKRETDEQEIKGMYESLVKKYRAVKQPNTSFEQAFLGEQRLVSRIAQEVQKNPSFSLATGVKTLAYHSLDQMEQELNELPNR